MKIKIRSPRTANVCFFLVTVNDKHMERRFKRTSRVKYKDDICAELRLKLWFESHLYFCNITESGWF